MAEDFFRQRAIRESNVLGAAEDLAIGSKSIHLEIMDEYFPQSFSKCTPSFGYSCQYERICHGPAKEAPLEMGFIKKDKSHQLAYFELAEKMVG